MTVRPLAGRHCTCTLINWSVLRQWWCCQRRCRRGWGRAWRGGGAGAPAASVTSYAPKRRPLTSAHGAKCTSSVPGVAAATLLDLDFLDVAPPALSWLLLDDLGSAIVDSSGGCATRALLRRNRGSGGLESELKGDEQEEHDSSRLDSSLQ